MYGKSKYFPEHLEKIGNVIKDKKQITNIVGCLFLLFSYVLMGNKFGYGTGFVIFLIALSLAYSLLVIILTIHMNYAYVIAIVSVVLILIENIL